jgi:hypothetical protein
MKSKRILALVTRVGAWQPPVMLARPSRGRRLGAVGSIDGHGYQGWMSERLRYLAVIENCPQSTTRSAWQCVRMHQKKNESLTSTERVLIRRTRVVGNLQSSPPRAGIPVKIDIGRLVKTVKHRPRRWLAEIVVHVRVAILKREWEERKKTPQPLEE